MNRPHKFVSNANAPKYGVVVWCEYCGIIVFYDNQDKQEYKENRQTDCPNSPQEREEGVKPSESEIHEDLILIHKIEDCVLHYQPELIRGKGGLVKFVDWFRGLMPKHYVTIRKGKPLPVSQERNEV